MKERSEVEFFQVQPYTDEIKKLENELFSSKNEQKKRCRWKLERILKEIIDEEIILGLFLSISVGIYIYYSFGVSPMLATLYWFHIAMSVIGLVGVLYPSIVALNIYKYYSVSLFGLSSFTTIGTGVFVFRKRVCQDLKTIFGAQDQLYQICLKDAQTFKLMAFLLVIMEVCLEVFIIHCVQMALNRLRAAKNEASNSESQGKLGSIFIS